MAASTWSGFLFSAQFSTRDLNAEPRSGRPASLAASIAASIAASLASLTQAVHL